MTRARSRRLLSALAVPGLAVALWVTASGIEAGSADVESLQAEVLGLIRDTGWSNSEWGVLAVSLERGDTLLALNPATPLAPASNQKLFTSAAALHHLGPEYRFPTFLLTDGEVRDGVLQGDLILYGTGDPAISARLLDSPRVPWLALARTLKEAGIHTVSGSLSADDSFFRGPKRSPSWREGYLDNWYAAPVSALTFAENVVTIHMRAGPAGSPARLSLVPEGAELRVLNRAVSVPGNTRRGLFLARDGPGLLRLEGQIGTEAGQLSRRLTVSDPSSVAASVLRTVLEEEGIRIEGGVSRVRSEKDSRLTGKTIMAPGFIDRPTGALRTLGVHYSPPLWELLQVLNGESHNLYAEILLFTLGRVVLGDGSLAGGQEALRRYLTDVVGVPDGELRIEDGSGLSALNRATPSAFVALLRHVAGSDYREPFWESLPEAGDRNLRRMYRSPAAGNLRAKTGTIRRVSALSGIVRTADDEPVLFSILSNRVPSSYRAKGIENRIGVELASFSRQR